MPKEIFNLIVVFLLVLMTIELYLILSIKEQNKCAYNANKQAFEVKSNEDVWIDFIVDTNEIESIYVESENKVFLKESKGGLW